MAFIRWLHRPSVLRMIVITIGVSLVIREVALHLWGQQVRALPYFTGDEVSALDVGGRPGLAPGALEPGHLPG